MQLSRFHQIRGPGLWSECDEFQEVSHFAGARHVDRGGAVRGLRRTKRDCHLSWHPGRSFSVTYR